MPKSLPIDPEDVRKPGEITFDPIPVNQYAKTIKEEKENTAKGERIYEKYQLVEEIINEVVNAREKYDIKEIKKRIKDHKIVKDVNKDGTVIVEL